MQQSYIENLEQYQSMVMDATNPSFGANLHEDEQEEQPNASAQGFYEMLVVARAPLWEGCSTLLELSTSIRLLNIKSNYNMPQ